MAGATFRDGKIGTASVDNDTLPEFQIFYASREETATTAAGFVQVPVYTNGTREHLLCTLPFQTGSTMSAEAIVLAGVALYVTD